MQQYCVITSMWPAVYSAGSKMYEACSDTEEWPYTSGAG